MTRNLALELAPVRVNLIAAGFVDTPERLLGEKIEDRRNQLRTTLPIRRVVEPADVAALWVQFNQADERDLGSCPVRTAGL
jgi:NAD(P)-dependent dehydrogenase (short-subunit alcohol dehydrogenase family)